MTVLRSGAASDVGRVRASNEDLALESATLFAVADGMGGHAGGEVAARTAIETLQARYDRSPTASGLVEAIAAANDAVWQQGQTDQRLRGMGTTLTAAALVPGADGGDVLVLANVGDSRAYLFADGEVHQLTADHSLAEEKVRMGEMSEAEAAVHPHRHILTRALGVGPGVDPDLWELHVQAGDRILLCSDGLSNEIDPPAIAAILGREHDPAAAAQVLVDAANAHGGNDNITAVIVDVLVGEDGPRAVATVPIGARPMPSPGTGPSAPSAAGNAGAELADIAWNTGDAPTTAVPAVVPGEPSPGARPTADGGVGSPDSPGAPVLDVARDDLPSGGTTDPTLVEDAGTSSREATMSPLAPVPPAAAGRARRVRRARGDGQRHQPRPVTIRVVVFVLVLAGIGIGAYYLVRWYATSAYYVTIDHGHLVVYQGRPGGVLGFDPKLVATSAVTTAAILPSRIAELRLTVSEPSLLAARHFIGNLHREYVDQLQTLPGGGSGARFGSATTTTTVVPNTTTTVPTTTAPAGTTSSSTSP